MVVFIYYIHILNACLFIRYNNALHKKRQPGLWKWCGWIFLLSTNISLCMDCVSVCKLTPTTNHYLYMYVGDEMVSLIWAHVIKTLSHALYALAWDNFQHYKISSILADKDSRQTDRDCHSLWRFLHASCD